MCSSVESFARMKVTSKGTLHTPSPSEVGKLDRDARDVLSEDMAWCETFDKPQYEEISRSVQERQVILHEFMGTEMEHFRSLRILKLFYQKINKLSCVSQETLCSLFPRLDELIEISKLFLKKMKEKRDGLMMNDLSDVFLSQFTGEMSDQIFSSFSKFSSGHCIAMEIYRQLFQKENFAKLMNEVHSLPECHGLMLPDFYIKITKHLSELLILMNRLDKVTKSLKLKSLPVLEKSTTGLRHLVSAVDQCMCQSKDEYAKSQLEVVDIQSKLDTNLSDIKSLDLTAYNRRLRKKGEAVWIGQDKQLREFH